MWYNVTIVIILVVLSGTFAGLTLARFSLKITSLERKVKLQDKMARKVYPLRKRGNLLLCTLLLGNVASYTVMAVFLGTLTSGIIASFIATSLIFVFGEILPQAVFPRFALEISYRLRGLIWACLILFYPVAAPIAWILDKVLGEEPPVLWSKSELKEIIKFHEDVGDGIIDADEEKIVLGALSFSELKVKNIMVEKDKVFFLDKSQKLSPDLLQTIREKGFSRIPVIDNKTMEIVGVLYAKNLIGGNFSNRKAGEISSTDILLVTPETQLDNLMNLLIKKNIHMALVTGKAEKFIGIVTLEDIMEEILKTELEEKKR